MELPKIKLKIGIPHIKPLLEDLTNLEDINLIKR